MHPNIIIYTRYSDGGVTLCYPSENIIKWMSTGGMWNDYPRGFVDIQTERQIADGRLPWAAAAFSKAVAFGGCTDAEALGIVRDRDCAHLGSAFELVDRSEFNMDFWFRDAWRRSHNGGPIYIDMRHARKIQTKKIIRLSKKDGFDLKLDLWRSRIRKAATPEELKNIWPRKER